MVGHVALLVRHLFTLVLCDIMALLFVFAILEGHILAHLHHPLSVASPANPGPNMKRAKQPHTYILKLLLAFFSGLGGARLERHILTLLDRLVLALIASLINALRLRNLIAIGSCHKRTHRTSKSKPTSPGIANPMRNHRSETLIIKFHQSHVHAQESCKNRKPVWSYSGGFGSHCISTSSRGHALQQRNTQASKSLSSMSEPTTGPQCKLPDPHPKRTFPRSAGRPPQGVLSREPSFCGKS